MFMHIPRIVAALLCGIVCGAVHCALAQPAKKTGGENTAGVKSSERPFRQWTDRTGKYKLQAAFVELKDGRVFLKSKGDGSTFSILLEKLSEADQRYVRSLQNRLRPRRTTEAATPAFRRPRWPG